LHRAADAVQVMQNKKKQNRPDFELYSAFTILHSAFYNLSPSPSITLSAPRSISQG
jgi:hypothetical protein